MDRLDELDFLLETQHELAQLQEKVATRLEVVLGLGERAVKPVLKLVVDNTKKGAPNA